jgi:S-adenosylmethionine:tRNA ribosyltransferase-isomerase
MTPTAVLCSEAPAGAATTGAAPAGAAMVGAAMVGAAMVGAASAGAAPMGIATEPFTLPRELEASAPAEARGRRRDEVRMMVARRFPGAEAATSCCAIEHRRFDDLPALLGPGDILVVNTSATLPASLDATGPGGEQLRLHLSTALPVAGLWSVELRLPAGVASRQYGGGAPGWRLRLAGGASAELLTPLTGSSRLWVARIDLPGGSGGLASEARAKAPGPEAGPSVAPRWDPGSGGLIEYLAAYGQPIRYPYVSDAWPIDAYQTIFADEPGSAEMPSAARAFTAEVVARLVTRGVEIAPLTLHTGVSSLEAGDAPYSEWFRVPFDTARRVSSVRRAGGRVIAVGTTVVRALESAADRTGEVHPAEGWTDLVVTPQRGVSTVDGMLTGWHEPRSSHLAMLEAVAGAELIRGSYREALERRYLWHEFGDLHLILPSRCAVGARELAR